jgi:transposase-like protein
MKKDTTMADSIVTPKEPLSKLPEGGKFDLFREALLSVLREIMETEVQTKTGVPRGERSSERICMRNNHRDRRLDTRLGSFLLPIPKLRKGSYFPSFLDPRRRSEEALPAVIPEAYVKGVSTRKVEDLVVALGLDGICHTCHLAL